jgi:anaerobic magnesium-protoporphyrin IX monomethyl ester cyclase
MRYSLINPPWSFDGSIYFGCREPHLPLEFGYSQALLERAGHEVQIVDAQLEDLTLAEVRRRVDAFRPDFTVVTTAPSYLFWRCAPPELRVPKQTIQAVRDVGGKLVVIGPHASTTPAATLRKLDVDVAVMGEC